MMDRPRDNRRIDSERFGSVGYCVEGTAAQKCVLIHGWNGHSGTWGKTIDAMKNKYTVIAPSLPPFFGDFADIPIADYTSTVEKIMRREGVTQTVLAGNSMGGWISMNCIIRNPGLASALILEDTAGAGYGNRVEDSSPYVEAIRESKIPTLIIWGEHDDVIPPSTGERLMGELPDSIYRVILGAGHVPHRDKPEAFIELVTVFLSDVNGTYR